MIVHATLLARRLAGRWSGVLVRGPSGAGKSDLALRALDAGWRLVADDRVRLWTSGDALYGAAPAPLAGLLELRGLGVLPQAAVLPFAAVRLAVDAAEAVERMPEPARETLLGVDVTATALRLQDASALPRLEQALAHALRARL